MGRVHSGGRGSPIPYTRRPTYEQWVASASTRYITGTSGKRNPCSVEHERRTIEGWPVGPNTRLEWLFWRPVVEKVLSFSEASRISLEELLDANEAMSVFGDRNDLQLRPPGFEDDNAQSVIRGEPGEGDTIRMSASAFAGVFG